mmetsp:Transcript_31406/g.78016  ORF Transcript_31406/g.78016 Transcript_31406/m.78016 type:complete len:217 (+) Transcript_31406:117-767(+)
MRHTHTHFTQHSSHHPSPHPTRTPLALHSTHLSSISTQPSSRHWHGVITSRSIHHSCACCGSPLPCSAIILWSWAISSTSSPTLVSQLLGTAHAKMHLSMPVSWNMSMSCRSSPPTMPLKIIMRATPNAGATAAASACSVSIAAPSVPFSIALVQVTNRTNSASISTSSLCHFLVSSGVNPTIRMASGPNLPSATPPGAESESASISRKSARTTVL